LNPSCVEVKDVICACISSKTRGHPDASNALKYKTGHEYDVENRI